MSILPAKQIDFPRVTTLHRHLTVCEPRAAVSLIHVFVLMTLQYNCVFPDGLEIYNRVVILVQQDLKEIFVLLALKPKWRNKPEMGFQQDLCPGVQQDLRLLFWLHDSRRLEDWSLRSSFVCLLVQGHTKFLFRFIAFQRFFFFSSKGGGKFAYFWTRNPWTCYFWWFLGEEVSLTDIVPSIAALDLRFSETWWVSVSHWASIDWTVPSHPYCYPALPLCFWNRITHMDDNVLRRVDSLSTNKTLWCPDFFFSSWDM